LELRPVVIRHGCVVFPVSLIERGHCRDRLLGPEHERELVPHALSRDETPEVLLGRLGSIGNTIGRSLESIC